MSESKSAAWYSKLYCEMFGFHLVPIEPSRKFPRSMNWGNETISDPIEAEKFWTEKQDWNMGIALAPSRMCSLDIDDDASFAVILDEFGIDPQTIQEAPTIQGRKKGRRIMYRIPEGVELPYQKLTWNSKNDPSGEKHKAAMKAAKDAADSGDKERSERIKNVAKRWARYTVLELRASCDGKQRQDVLPPSIHPDTGEPYKWLSQPQANWSEPPAWLLSIWLSWDSFKPQLSAMCPWIPKEKQEPQQLAKKAKTSSNAIGGNVIEAFCEAHDLTATLIANGYEPKGRTRFLSPYSGTGLPGVVLLPDGKRCFIHHASDPLCSDDTGKPVNAFDLFCYYQHNGDIKKAVKQAAEMLGMNTPSVRHNEQASEQEIPSDWYKKIEQQYSSESGSRDIDSSPVEGSRDYISPLLWTNDKGRPLKHIDNLREICRRLGVVIRYNVIKKNEELLIPNESFTMDNEANASLAWLASECSLFNFPTDKLGEFITYLGDQNQFNPVASWIESKPWDGHSRIRELCDTITAKHDEELKNILIERWLISAVAAAYLPDGISAAGVLVFQGEQYLGKTKWFKKLVPSELDLIQDGMLLKADDKDSVKQICSFWLVELGELDATFRKSDIAQLKSFITKSVDILRPAYARREAKYPRRTVFFGSVNPREFLHDPTGNRRFWTIECEHINHDHEIDMQQLWSEVLHKWKGGEGYYLSGEEHRRLNEHNVDFTSIDPIEERLLDRLNFDAPLDAWRWEQASAVLMECGLDRPTRGEASTAGNFLRTRNQGQSKKSGGKKLLLCPPLKINFYAGER
jgi:hypothetical protein